LRTFIQVHFNLQVVYHRGGLNIINLHLKHQFLNLVGISFFGIHTDEVGENIQIRSDTVIYHVFEGVECIFLEAAVNQIIDF
jgi:hypothetical protein